MKRADKTIFDERARFERAAAAARRLHWSTISGGGGGVGDDASKTDEISHSFTPARALNFAAIRILILRRRANARATRMNEKNIQKNYVHANCQLAKRTIARAAAQAQIAAIFLRAPPLKLLIKAPQSCTTRH